MKVLAISQARMGSTRLPGKVMKKIEGTPLLQIHIDRIGKSKEIDKFIIATTDQEADDELCEYLGEIGQEYYRGSEEDVLARFFYAAEKYNPDYVIRITSDCPLIDPELIDLVIQQTIQSQADYGSNVLNETYPDGQDIEVFKFSALKEAFNKATIKSDREHVTPYIRNNTSFKKYSVDNDQNYGHIRMTVDQQEDYEVIRKVCEHLGFDKTWKDYADFIESSKEINEINAGITRNEGYQKSKKLDNEQ